MKLALVTFLLSTLRLAQSVLGGVRQAGAVVEYTVQIEARQRNGQWVPATLTITSQTTRQAKRGTLQSGAYTVALPAGDTYQLEAQYKGFQTATKLLRLDRITDTQQARQTVLLEMIPAVGAQSPIVVTVVDYETGQLVNQKLNVQAQDVMGGRVVMTGPPRAGRFTLSATSGQQIQLTVGAVGYVSYTYNVDVRERNDIIIRLRRATAPPVQAVTAPEAANPQPVQRAEPTPAPPTPKLSTPQRVDSNLNAEAIRKPTPIRPMPQPAKLPAPDPKINTDLTTLAAGKAVTLDNVYFDQSSYLLRPESYPQLNELVGILKNRPTLTIEISGHTDNVGDPRLNLALSENRARVITNYLTTRGVKADRLVYKGYGQTQPVAPNDTEENKRRNRRVEVRILKNASGNETGR